MVAGIGIYGIARAGVEMLTRVLAAELVVENIQVNAVAPCMVKTGFSAPFWPNEETHEEIARNIPLGRLAETEDIVHPVLFLCSGGANFITAQVINVDGDRQQNRYKGGCLRMKHKEMQWQTNDGLPLFAQKWEPARSIKGAICLVHGLGEHSGRYVHWAEKFTNSGYALLSIDLPGHGKSGGDRGDTPTFDHFADHINLMLDEAEKLYPGKPCFLYGHSLGGIIALFYIIQRRPQLQGAVITSPGLRTILHMQKDKIAMAYILGSIIPRVSIPNNLELEGLSRDPAVVAAYRADPLVHNRISLRMGKKMIEAINYIFDRAAEIELPLLLMHGTADQITFASGSEELSELVSGECNLKLWDGLYHELHNENEKDEIFAFLKDWLDSKI